MRRIALLLPMVALLVSVPAWAQLAAPGAGSDRSPAVGAIAPDFEFGDTTMEMEAQRLSDLRGTKVFLMFFPGAFTRGCTLEFTEAGEYYQEFVDLGIQIIGISRDLRGALAAFGESVGARNVFLSDPNLTVSEIYGADIQGRGAARVAARFYFLIDEEGRIVWKNTANQLIPTERLLADFRAMTSTASR